MSKIINDPIYGTIEIPDGLIMQLIEHPYVQRLRRIQQLGVSHYVYPGATHTRFHHSTGAMHLTMQAVQVLRSKGCPITEAEAEGVVIAILLHDIGHGPFSHSLEHFLVNVSHETLTVLLMEQLNKEFDGALSVAIKIFKKEYNSKPFLHQLVSGQLDMDRLDYLTRDSFFTGVYEGKVGYDRLLKTLNVQDNKLVVEYKGIYSIENFLNARRLMYWQVYLHKNVICAGEMLIAIIKRARVLIQAGRTFNISDALLFFLKIDLTQPFEELDIPQVLDAFYYLDDADILSAIKVFTKSDDFVLQLLAKSVLERKLFKIELRNHQRDLSSIPQLKKHLKSHFNCSDEALEYLIISGKETNRAYKVGEEEINIALSNGETKPISQWREHSIQKKEVAKYFLCYPRT